MKALMSPAAGTCARVQPGDSQTYLCKECFSLETDKYCRKPVLYKDCCNTVLRVGIASKDVPESK